MSDPSGRPPVSDATTGDCGLDPEALAAFLDNRLDPGARRAVEEHLANCEQCRWVAGHVVTLFPPMRQR